MVLQARRILVVDDNVDAAESLAAILTDEGHEVTVAFDGPQALAHMERALPEVVLLDVGLPGMNGLVVAAKVRASRDFNQVRLIAVTGYGQPNDFAATKAAGFDAHLTKPFEFDRLIQLLCG
jgi:CheY-like chemotaxis protein